MMNSEIQPGSQLIDSLLTIFEIKGSNSYIDDLAGKLNGDGLHLSDISEYYADKLNIRDITKIADIEKNINAFIDINKEIPLDINKLNNQIEFCNSHKMPLFRSYMLTFYMKIKNKKEVNALYNNILNCASQIPDIPLILEKMYSVRSKYEQPWFPLLLKTFDFIEAELLELQQKGESYKHENLLFYTYFVVCVICIESDLACEIRFKKIFERMETQFASNLSAHILYAFVFDHCHKDQKRAAEYYMKCIDYPMNHALLDNDDSDGDSDEKKREWQALKMQISGGARLRLREILLQNLSALTPSLEIILKSHFIKSPTSNYHIYRTVLKHYLSALGARDKKISDILHHADHELVILYYMRRKAEYKGVIGAIAESECPICWESGPTIPLDCAHEVCWGCYIKLAQDRQCPFRCPILHPK